MPYVRREGVSIFYEEHGIGFPVLLLAPGGMESKVEAWHRVPVDPLRVYAGDFRLIAMDQRNAGRSRGTLEIDDPWGAYAADQLAVLDHLGIGRFHVVGCCIGGSFILNLMRLAPERVVSAVLELPIGSVGSNHSLFDEGLWRDWSKRLLVDRPDISADDVEAFAHRMWQGEWVFTVDREFVAGCTTPLLVLPGADDIHPGPVGREIAALAPNGRVIEPWQDTPEQVEQTVASVRAFLREHTPDA